MLLRTSVSKLTILFALILVMFCALPGCDDYDTNVVGTNFSPYNSLVSRFVHPVFVEFRGGGVRVWGPNAQLVSAERNGGRISITSMDDSLALVVYGNAVGDSLQPLDGQLKVVMENDFAIYLNGLNLHSKNGPAIEVQADDANCYLVVSNSSTNVLSDTVYQTQYANGAIQEADGCLYVSGVLYMDGKGTLTLNNHALPRWDSDWGDSVYTHALYAKGGMICNYALTANLTSLYGDAIHTGGAQVRLVKGIWNLYPGRDTINTGGADIIVGDTATIYVNDSICTAFKYNNE